MTSETPTTKSETRTTLQDAKDTFDAMKASGVLSMDTSKNMVVRRIDIASAMAVYKNRVYLLRDTSGKLDYADLNRSTVRATEVVGW